MSLVSRVLPDANVFFSRTLTDWISLPRAMSNPPIYEVCWTEDILAEARYTIRRRYPGHPDGPLTRRFDRIRREFPIGRIDGFDVDPLCHPDPDDAHVISAARHGGVHYLVTNDAGFFTADTAESFEVHTADSFLVLLDDSAPTVIRDVTHVQQTYFERTRERFSLPRMLESAGAPEFAERVREHLQHI